MINLSNVSTSQFWFQTSWSIQNAASHTRDKESNFFYSKFKLSLVVRDRSLKKHLVHSFTILLFYLLSSYSSTSLSENTHIKSCMLCFTEILESCNLLDYIEHAYWYNTGELLNIYTWWVGESTTREILNICMVPRWVKCNVLKESEF